MQFCLPIAAFADPPFIDKRFYDPGILTVNVVPFPGTLSTSMAPRWFWMMRNVIARTQPGTVVLGGEKGAEELLPVLGGDPRSRVRDTHFDPAAAPGAGHAHGTTPGIAWIAFKTRFSRACFSSPASSPFPDVSVELFFDDDSPRRAAAPSARERTR